MNVYTYSKARQNFASLLEQAVEEGEVRIKRKDGRIFVIKPETASLRAFPYLWPIDTGPSNVPSPSAPLDFTTSPRRSRYMIRNGLRQ